MPTALPPSSQISSFSRRPFSRALSSASRMILPMVGVLAVGIEVVFVNIVANYYTTVKDARHRRSTRCNDAEQRSRFLFGRDALATNLLDSCLRRLSQHGIFRLRRELEQRQSLSGRWADFAECYGDSKLEVG